MSPGEAPAGVPPAEVESVGDDAGEVLAHRGGIFVAGPCPRSATSFNLMH